MPSVQVSGTQALITCLYVFVVFSVLHLVAISYPDSKWSRGLLALGW